MDPILGKKTKQEADMKTIQVPASALKVDETIKNGNIVYIISELERTNMNTRVLLIHKRYGTQTLFSWHNHAKVKLVIA